MAFTSFSSSVVYRTNTHIRLPPPYFPRESIKRLPRFEGITLSRYSAKNYNELGPAEDLIRHNNTGFNSSHLGGGIVKCQVDTVVRVCRQGSHIVCCTWLQQWWYKIMCSKALVSSPWSQKKIIGDDCYFYPYGEIVYGVNIGFVSCMLLQW